MIITHRMNYLPRLIGPAFSQRLRLRPAVVVTGARQTGRRARGAVLEGALVLPPCRPKGLVGSKGRGLPRVDDTQHNE